MNFSQSIRFQLQILGFQLNFLWLRAGHQEANTICSWDAQGLIICTRLNQKCSSLFLQLNRNGGQSDFGGQETLVIFGDLRDFEAKSHFLFFKIQQKHIIPFLEDQNMASVERLEHFLKGFLISTATQWNALKTEKIYIGVACFKYNTFMRTIILIALAIVGTLEVNYQQRCLYYSESDFVCVNQKAIDQIILNVGAYGKQLIREKVWGATVCADYLRPENIIVSGNVWGIANVQENTFIKIRDQTNFMALKDWIYRIVQNSTIKDVATIKGQKYNCRIVGDQTVKHYGVGIRGQKDCEYNIDCVKIEEIAQQ